MSLYNMLFGVNPFSTVLLEMLGVAVETVPRFRDCFLNEDGTEIIIHTRTGGGNRRDYMEGNAALTKVSGYKFDADDSFDITYANFHYAVPEPFKEAAVLLKDIGAASDPAQRWQEVIDGLRRGDKSNPQVARALEVGEKIMKQINDQPDGGIVSI